MSTDADVGNAREKHETTVLDAPDGHRVHALLWTPAGRPSGTVQIVHGLAEHAARYERFAAYLANLGFAVIAHNHRGHGAHLDSSELGHFAERDGWQKVLGDVELVHAFAARRFGPVPRLLFGHSMGSYIAQAFVMQDPAACNALVLSGSTSAPRLQLYLGRFAAWVEGLLRGRQHRSASLNAQAFGAFNKRFAPARTDFDWLSRDSVEVDRYVNDPACGAVSSTALWQDLLGGLLDISKKSALKKIPADLPVLITGGSDDPVGGQRGMQRLYDAYLKSGHRNVTLRVFEQARHELLNETNRDEFMRFVSDWMREAVSQT